MACPDQQMTAICLTQVGFADSERLGLVFLLRKPYKTFTTRGCVHTQQALSSRRASGNPAVVGPTRPVRPVTLRPQLSLGLPFTAATNDAGEYTIVMSRVNRISVCHRRQNGAQKTVLWLV